MSEFDPEFDDGSKPEGFQKFHPTFPDGSKPEGYNDVPSPPDKPSDESEVNSGERSQNK